MRTRERERESDIESFHEFSHTVICPGREKWGIITVWSLVSWSLIKVAVNPANPSHSVLAGGQTLVDVPR